MYAHHNGWMAVVSNDAQELRGASESERLAREAGLTQPNPITHQIGHAARAIGEKLVQIGERLDRHPQDESVSFHQPGLAHK